MLQNIIRIEYIISRYHVFILLLRYSSDEDEQDEYLKNIRVKCSETLVTLGLMLSYRKKTIKEKLRKKKILKLFFILGRG